MAESNLHSESSGDLELYPQHLPPLQTDLQNRRLAVIQFLATLNHVMASWHRRDSRGGVQVVMRFHNGYGAIISEYQPVEGIYEIAPLRFHGPGLDDHEFYFRSHVPDLTWCSDQEEMVGVCEQIARLLPTAQA